MKKILTLAVFITAIFTFNAKAIEGIRITPGLGVNFATGAPDSSVAGDLFLDLGAVKKLNETSDLEFGLGFGFTTPLNFSEAGQDGISATDVNGNQFQDLNGSAVPLYLKLGYTKYLNEKNFVTTNIKLGYSSITGADQESTKLDLAGGYEYQRDLDVDGGLYLALSAGYGFGKFVVSANYQMIGGKTVQNDETTLLLGDVDIVDAQTSVNNTNHVFGVGLSYRFDMLLNN